MKNTYPVILTPDEPGYVVFIPDFNINTEGYTLTEAIEMARDAISLMGVEYEDKHKELPTPSKVNDIKKETENDILTLVDVDFDAYRRMLDNRTVKKNCTIPSWLNEKAEQAHINFSAVLQSALKEKLNL